MPTKDSYDATNLFSSTLCFRHSTNWIWTGLQTSTVFMEHDVMPAKPNYNAIVIMVLEYPAYSGPYRHWLSTGVCTPAGESARAADKWKDDTGVSFTSHICGAAMGSASSPRFLYIVSPSFFQPGISSIQRGHSNTAHRGAYLNRTFQQGHYSGQGEVKEAAAGRGVVPP